jgi:hypothetical protein
MCKKLENMPPDLLLQGKGGSKINERGVQAPHANFFPFSDPERVRVKSCIEIPNEYKNQMQTKPSKPFTQS